MFLEIVMIILGFILLIIGANTLVEGSTNIAKRFHIPEILIGLTILALGTSAPELIVTITSANKGTSDLIIGNALGSNLCNLLLILGITAILSPIKIDKDTKIIHIPTSFLSTLLVLVMGLGIFYGDKVINRTDGIILILLAAVYLIYPVVSQIKDITEEYKQNKNKKIKNNKIWKSIIFITVGIIALKYGGDLVVDNSINLAKRFNISETIIGITIIAFGTSLPELVTSIIAIIKKDNELALGNLIGSCILNLLLILGVGAVIVPINFSSETMQSIIILLITNILIWIFCFIGKKNMITRLKGLVLLIFFIFYIYKTLVR